MEITKFSIDGAQVKQQPLTHALEQNGFVLAEQWDYERVTYDLKINSPEKNITYYLRLRGLAVEGSVEKGSALIKLMPPLLGKHYYPHGVEYGEEEFPNNVHERVDRVLSKVEADLKEFEE
ncbi:YugN family protein [Alkalibacillus haloalkaliphilus]|uniref:YugN family protein n=1 Tax=Alkalibacillus haloalkaliphilus TaxID=94136 RepID=UPI0002E76A9C|nr:YugN family protein [Alkalibacillus haloalkaliphilus]